jgi:hypothetical protein
MGINTEITETCFKEKERFKLNESTDYRKNGKQ